MKAIFERHAEQLSDEERLAIWKRLSMPPTRRSRASVRRALLAAALAAVAVAVYALTVQQREPVAPQPMGPAKLAETLVRPRVQAPIAREGARRVAGAPRTRPADSPAPAPAAAADRATVMPEAAAALPSPATPSQPAVANTGVVAGRITDSRNLPVPYANVIVLGTRLGAIADEQGNFSIPGVPAARQQVKLMATGYSPLIQSVQVNAGATSTIEFTLGAQLAVRQVDEIQVRAEKRIETRSSTTKQSISAERLREVPVDNLGQAASRRTGATAPGDALHFRGGRSGEVRYQFDGATRGAAPVPVIPTTGGTRLPNDEAFDSMFFKSYGVNPFVATDEDPISTFAVDVDAASYTLMRRYVGLGHLPPADAVRVEEFVNFFPQGYPRFANDDFRILVDGAPSPFGAGYYLLRIGLKGREIAERNRTPAQLTFVIDVSGSMERENRLELVKRALRLLVDQLRAGDAVGVVVYGTQGRVLLEPVALGRSERVRESIVQAIEQLHPEGSTNAEQGLLLAYEMARRAYRPGAINRIVLCSDGVANVGRTGPESILARVRSEADRGIHLTTIGFGMGNYNDVLMEQLADRGDGNHYYVDDLDEARRVFVENLTGTLQTIAKDAKVQVEFDSTRVLRYRLLGFENRDVADRDFRNDNIDAGEIGAGHEVTALYEVKVVPGVSRGMLATVRLRYSRPEPESGGGPVVREIAQRFDASALGRRFEDAAPRFRLDAAVAEFAEILRGSYWARESRLSDVLSVARSAARSLGDDGSAEFVSLVEKAAALGEPSSRGAREGER